MDDKNIQQKSVSHLKNYLVTILNSILESTDLCPHVMKQVFRNLYNTAAQRFTDNEEVSSRYANDFTRCIDKKTNYVQELE